MSVVDYKGKRLFPIKGKRPLVKEWQETKPDELSVSHTTNFGWALDDTDFILDVDPRNGGEESFVNLCRDCGINLEEFATVKVETGGGGLHLVFKKPADVKIRKKHNKYSGLDFLSKGSFVVGVGSIHPDTEKTYEFTIDSASLDEANEVPRNLLSLLVKNEADYSDTPQRDFTDSPNDIKHFIGVLERDDGAFEGDNGDSKTFRMAALGKDYGLTPETTYELMSAHWNQRCNPPWDEETLAQKVGHAYRYGNKPVGVKTGAVAFDGLVSEITEEASNAAKNEPLEADLGELNAAQDLEAKKETPTSKARQGYKAKLDVAVENDLFDGYDNNEPSNSKKVISRLFPNGWLLKTDFEIRYFNGKYYERWTDERLKQVIQNELSVFGIRHSVIQNTVSCVKNDVYIQGVVEDPISICFENGILRLKNEGAELVEHTPEIICFNKKNMDYSEDKGEPTAWLNFLNSSLDGDQDRISLLQEWMGYSLIYGNQFQKILILVGKSRCGKGTIGRVMHQLNNSVGITLEGLCGDFGLASIADARSAIIGDAHRVRPQNYERAKEVLLSVSGRDMMDINDKHTKIRSQRMETKITMMCNSIPGFSDGADALSNRYLIIPFNKSFAGKEDIYLDAKLDKEMDKIMNWAVKGLYRLLDQQRFTVGKESKKELELLKRKYNQIGAFIEEYCEVGNENVVNAKTAYDAYVRFCMEEDRKPNTRATFQEKLSLALEDFDVIRDNRSTMFKGFGIKDDVFGELKGILA